MALIDIQSLKKARNQLKESLDYGCSDLAKNDIRLAVQFRSAAIQAFEYTYELSIKMLKRHLREFESDAEIQQAVYRELIRMGAVHGLIDKPTDWFRYRDLRNSVAHTYDELKAGEVASNFDGFLQSVNQLIDAFERTRHAANG